MIWCFFSNGDFPSCMFTYFFGTALFSEKLLLHNSSVWLLWHSSYFFRATISSQQLRFWNSHFFAAVIFSKYLLFWSKTSTKQPLLENRKFFRQLLFGTTTFLAEELLTVKISMENLFFQSRYFCTASAFFEKVHFSEKKYYALPTFSGELYF